MAQIMNEQQRQEALAEYNPKDHLIKVGMDKATGKAVLYYPAAWRLYELHLRYANANFKSEIVYHDQAKGTVIVKAYLYLGKNYEDSDKKAEAMKQGNISSLDKVETAAKARCARDFGIGTEYALDMTPDETDATHDSQPPNDDTKGRATSKSAQQSTNRATSSAHTNKTDPKPEIKKLDDIPSARSLRQEVEALQIKTQNGAVMDWRAALYNACRDLVDSKAVTLASLESAGNELGPEYCQRVDTFLTRFRKKAA